MIQPVVDLAMECRHARPQVRGPSSGVTRFDPRDRVLHQVDVVGADGADASSGRGSHWVAQRFGDAQRG
jgi:hypothetical protein